MGFYRIPLFVFGTVMSLESMRRGFMGGSALSLFIDISIDNKEGCKIRIAFMKMYLDVEEYLLTQIPVFLAWAAGPFIDYHKAQRCFFTIAETLCGRLDKRSCADIWYPKIEEPSE